MSISVFFTPAIDAPLERVDAATGRTLQRYEQTAATEEILFDDGVLFLTVNRPDDQIEFDSVQAARRLDGGVRFNLDPRRILAVDADSGATLWQRESVVMPTTLAVDGQRVYFHDGQSVVCLDRSSGDELWKQPVSRWSVMQTFFTPTLVVYDGVPQFMIRSQNDLFSVAASGRKVLNQWHHLAGVLTADKRLKIFVDGQLMGTEKVPRLIAEEPLQTMEIGSDEVSSVGDYRSPFPLGGWIDDVKVYFGEVTDDEIARHAAEGPQDTQTAQAELVFHATFDDGTAKDTSGKAHHGNVVGIEAVDGKFGKALRFEATRRAAEARFFVEHKWNRDVPILVRAMTKAGDRLFVAGPPDLLDEEAAFTALYGA